MLHFESASSAMSLGGRFDALWSNSKINQTLPPMIILLPVTFARSRDVVWVRAYETGS